MYPRAFEYHAASDVPDALDLLAEHGDRDVEFMAGGHSLLPTMKSGLATPDVVIDLGDVDTLTGIDHGDGSTRIGAMTTYAELVADDELDRTTGLSEAAASIADAQVRNMGTIGGNVAHADPAADLPAAVLAADATIHVQGPDDERTVPASSFFEGMFATALGEDELLTAIDVPHLGPDDAAAYAKKPSPSSGYAMVGVAVVLETDGDHVTGARVAANGAFDYARRLSAVESALAGQSLDDDGAAATAAEHATDDVEDYMLMDDTQASGEFRAHLLGVFTRRAIETAMDRAGDGGN